MNTGWKLSILGILTLFVGGLGCSDSTAGNTTAEEESEVDVVDVPENTAGGEGGTTTPEVNIYVPVQDDFGDPCDSNEECSSGFCVEGPDGFICTQTCLESCPKGYSCKSVTNLGPDAVFICIPDATVDPCEGKANGAKCDDGSPCTINEKCIDGDCIGGDNIDCEDGNPCTSGACDFKYGCLFEPTDSSCEDDDICTQGGACVEGECVGSDPIECNDGDPCTDDICDPILGCTYPETDCDDGNPGTLDICLGDGCNNIETCDGIDKTPTLCSITGKKGDIVPCNLNVASIEQLAGQANSLQLSIIYSPLLVKPSFFSSCETCNQEITSGMSLPSGHTFTFSPMNLENWDGQGEMIVLSLGNPYPITDAYMESQELKGDSTFVTLHFELIEDLDTSMNIFGENVIVGDDIGAPLHYFISSEAILTSVFINPCEFNGEPCDDGNACTINETCVAKVCAGEVQVCDDGEICTFDFCDVTLGCFHQTVEDDCACHDGNICTESGSCQQGTCETNLVEGCN